MFNKLSSYEMLELLREKAKALKVQRIQLKAHRRVLEIQNNALDTHVTASLVKNQFAIASHYDRDRVKVMKRIESLDKVDYAIAMDQRSLGLCIQRVLAFQSVNAKRSFDQLKDEVLRQLLRTHEYKFRHYVIGEHF